MYHRILTCIASILLTCLPACALAANYFVDAVSGNDAFTGTSATTANGSLGPWRTLAKVNAAGLQPGDIVHFRCGQSWRGTLRIASSSDPARPIRYSRFGSDCNEGNKPLITTADAIGGWQPYSGNIWVASASFPVTHLYADGVGLRLAQYPNPGYQAQAWAHGMMVVDAPAPIPNGFLGLRDAELAAIAGQDLIGAGLHIRINDFNINDRTVVAFDPGWMEITLNQRTDWSIRANWGYYLDNKLWMLDEPGEFFYDGSNPDQKKVYVWMPDGGSPAGRVVGATDGYAIDASGAANVIIEAMRAEKAGVGVALPSSTNVVVRTTDVADSYYRGILANGATGGTIDSCTVRRSVREGILLGTATNFRVVNNRVIDSGVVGSPKSSRGGISSFGSGVAIGSNYVLNSGGHGIAFSKKSDVANNYVENSCLILNDCAGIYTGNASGDASAHDSFVIANTVVGVVNDRNGRDPAPVEAITPGIYIDYRTSGVYVARNTVIRADTGLFIAAASNNTFADNTFYDYVSTGVRIKEYSFARITSPNRILRNRVFGLSNEVPQVIFMPITEDTSAMATFDSNRYSALYTDNSAIMELVKVTLQLNGVWTTRSMNFQQWRQAGYDANGSLFDHFSIAPFAFQPVTGLNLLANGGFDTDLAGWRSYAAQGDASLARTTGCPVPGCALLTTGSLSPSGSLISGSFPVQAGKTYVISFDTRSAGLPVTYNVIPRLAGPRSFDLFDNRYSVTATDTWRRQKILFAVSTSADILPSDNGGRTDLAVPPGQAVYFDGFRVEEVVSTQNLPGDDSVILLNTTNFSGTFNCPDALSAPSKCGEYVYFDTNTAVAWPVTVPARQSVLLVWAGNPFRR